MEQESITYEQPLNEHIRVCLRLEYLFTQTQHYLDGESTWDAHNALVTIIEILNVIDRPDLKSKLYNALRLHSIALMKLTEAPGIHKDKLMDIIHQLDMHIDVLHNISGKIGQNLRENEFLTAIRQRLNIAGGICGFSIPAYHLWLQLPTERKRKDLNAWYDSFKQLRAIVGLLLHLTRNGTLAQAKLARSGFYQEGLNTEIDYQLIRVIMSKGEDIYPDISLGRHRLSIHFFKLNTAGRAIQMTDDVDFKLTCCKI